VVERDRHHKKLLFLQNTEADWIMSVHLHSQMAFQLTKTTTIMISRNKISF